MWNKNRRGSNLIYIIILMAILGILAAAYSAVSIYSARSAAEQRRHEQDYITAVSLRDTFVDMAEDNYSSTDSMTRIEMGRFIQDPATQYSAYIDDLDAYDGMSPEEQAEASEPEFDDYEKTVTGEADLPEGKLKQSHTLNLIEESKRHPKCWMLVEIEFTSKETKKTYKLGARLEPDPQFTEHSVSIDGWKAVRFYEVE